MLLLYPKLLVLVVVGEGIVHPPTPLLSRCSTGCRDRPGLLGLLLLLPRPQMGRHPAV